MKIEKWSVYHANLDPVIGSEQAPLSVVLRSGDYGLGKYGRVSDPGCFTHSSWFFEMVHCHRDRVPAGIYES